MTFVSLFLQFMAVFKSDFEESALSSGLLFLFKLAWRVRIELPFAIPMSFLTLKATVNLDIMLDMEVMD